MHGVWTFSRNIPDVGTKISFCGNIFMISKSNIDAANTGLFILSHTRVPPKILVALMAFSSPIYCQLDYLYIVKIQNNNFVIYRIDVC